MCFAFLFHNFDYSLINSCLEVVYNYKCSHMPGKTHKGDQKICVYKDLLNKFPCETKSCICRRGVRIENIRSQFRL